MTSSQWAWLLGAQRRVRQHVGGVAAPFLNHLHLGYSKKMAKVAVGVAWWHGARKAARRRWRADH